MHQLITHCFPSSMPATALATAFDTYVDLSFIGLYQAWVQLFGVLVSIAVILSVLVAVDRLLQVPALLCCACDMSSVLVNLGASGGTGIPIMGGIWDLDHHAMHRLLLSCTCWCSSSYSSSSSHCLSYFFSKLPQVCKYVAIALRTRLAGVAPEHRAPRAPLPSPKDDPTAWPLVAVQLPMFNERAVCQAAIDCACGLTWPSSRLVVQVGVLEEGSWVCLPLCCQCFTHLLPAISVCLQCL